MNTKKKNNEGFTLVELIIVIAIIAILAVVLAPNLVKWIDKSRASTDISNATTLEREVKTASISVQQADGNILAADGTDGKIILSKADPSITGLATGENSITEELDKTDKNWNTITFKHRNKYNKNGKQITTDDEIATYTITVSATDVSGEWGTETKKS